MLPRAEGGRGLTDIKTLHNKQVLQLREYFLSRKSESLMHQAVCEADKHLTCLKLSLQQYLTDEQQNPMKDHIIEWKKMALHGKHPQELCLPQVDKEASNTWLTKGDLYPETEGFVLAIQDQVIHTKNYVKHIIKDGTVKNDRCCRCCLKPETIQHVTSGCEALAGTDYLQRHDQVAKIVHEELSIVCGLVDTRTPYYKYENAEFYLLFNRTVLTDRTVDHNRPDLVFHRKKDNVAFIIDIAIPNTHNMQTKAKEKINKYSKLKEEIGRVWKTEKVDIIPIILSATGIIPSDLFQNLEKLHLPRHLFLPMQKAVILETCRIVRKFFKKSILRKKGVLGNNPVPLLIQPRKAENC